MLLLVTLIAVSAFALSERLARRRLEEQLAKSAAELAQSKARAETLELMHDPTRFIRDRKKYLEKLNEGQPPGKNAGTVQRP